MKKVIIIIIILIAISILSIYLLIPSQLIVTSITAVHGSTAAVNRTLVQEKNWKTLWKNAKEINDLPARKFPDEFFYKNDTFNVSPMLLNALKINISNKKFNANSLLTAFPLTKDSIALQWSFTVPVSINPFIRFTQYLQAVNTKKNMSFLLKNMKQYLGKNENIYGISVQQTTTTDTTMVSTSSTFNHYPSTNDIYHLIKKLQTYINENHASETGNPLLNISKEDNNQYRVMVALPTNYQLPSKGDITLKRMIPGNFLTTTVTGGYKTVDEAYRHMQQYFQDYQRVAMAIPFQVLVTDRLQTADTSKWVTKLYFPVF